MTRSKTTCHSKIMTITRSITAFYQRYFPSPFTIAIMLTLVTMLLAFLVGDNKGWSGLVSVFSYWEQGIWNNDLLVFAYQMMLILVLGNVLVLSSPMQNLIGKLTQYATTTQNAVVLVSVTTMLVAFFNWGLGLIYGAILARQIGEHMQRAGRSFNYPLIGAAGYSGLMIWHGGISGSAPIKVAETGHLTSLMNGVGSPESIALLPQSINFDQTIFSSGNLLIFLAALVFIPLTLNRLAKFAPSTTVSFKGSNENYEESFHGSGERLDHSRILSMSFGFLVLMVFFIQYSNSFSSLQITPNMLNFFMFGLALILHRNFAASGQAVGKAISGASGILIQFPLYFGIMGIMKGAGLVVLLSNFFVGISTAVTLPIFTFFSAGLVNIFVPSGGGQWAIQGPIIIESAQQLGVPLPKMVLALAYGDQITNMLQPFWALPLLGITQIKAKDLLPYTLVMMLVGVVIFGLGLLLI